MSRTKSKPRPAPLQWESLEAAAERLGRHVGHLRRLCPALARHKLARWVKGGGKRSHWQIRQDAELPTSAEDTATLDRPQPIVLTVGETSIRISSPAPVTLTITPSASGGGKRSRTPYEGRPIDIR